MLNKPTKAIIIFAFSVIIAPISFAQTRHTISGFVYEKGSRETMIGVNVFISGKPIGTATNSYGFYSLSLPADSFELVFSFVGYQPRSFKINLTKNIDLNVELDPSIELEGVEVHANLPKSSSRSSQMSIVEIPISQIKSIPAIIGEKDALKVIQLMPGVQKGSEGNSGLYVRGGGPDQNLIILDDAPVYNAYHLFGFFSLFNGDALKSIELIKVVFPPAMEEDSHRFWT
ncbi:MAG TPA: TonB-dependent receptor [Tenuifilaceae bacterium]|nr:TonB-dependent receptor [Tenuifilaceae bacterium]HPE17092.1 TonB-dependent receptor [Tenuifilaceae bacterium]HPQ32886.1 TonB-dependent receptor [Tenuifilaceae bacterium]